MSIRNRVVCGATLAALALGGCGDDSDGSGSAGTGGGAGTVGTGLGGQSGDTSGTGGASDGIGGGGTTDGPPPECYAPCLWALVSGCRPAGACTSEDRGDLRLLCDSSSAWRYENDTFSSTITVLGQDGLLCYAIESANAMPTYLDASGNVVVTLDISTRVDGRYLATCADGTQYYSDHNAPECLTWAMPTCTEGVCP